MKDKHIAFQLDFICQNTALLNFPFIYMYYYTNICCTSVNAKMNNLNITKHICLKIVPINL